MASGVAERIQLVKLCGFKDWSKAIRVLDSLLSQPCVIQDLCQLELHKHVIKVCDKALQLYSPLGIHSQRKLFQFERKVAGLKRLFKLERLLGSGKQNGSIVCENHAVESAKSSSAASEPVISVDSTVTIKNRDISNRKIECCSKSTD